MSKSKINECLNVEKPILRASLIDQIKIENTKALKSINIEEKYKNGRNYEGWNIQHSC